MISALTLRADQSKLTELTTCLIEILRKDYKGLDTALNSPRTRHFDMIPLIYGGYYDDYDCNEVIHRDLVVSLFHLSQALLGFHLPECTRDRIAKRLDPVSEKPTYINNDKYIEFLQSDEVEATAILMISWQTDIVKKPEVNEYCKNLAIFANRQEDKSFTLKAIRTNVLFDHRAYYLTKFAEFKAKRAMFVYDCTIHRTYMEKLAPKSDESNQTRAWTTYWEKKVDDAIETKEGPVWELLQDRGYAKALSAREVKEGGSQLYSHLSKPIHGTETLCINFEAYHNELRWEIVHIIKQLYDDGEKAQVSAVPLSQQFEEWGRRHQRARETRAATENTEEG